MGEGGLVTPHTGVLPTRTIQKTAEATGDLVGNEIADKITSASKKSTKQ